VVPGRLQVMTGPDLKATLLLYLTRGREALLWKLDGLGEYEIRRPMTPTATSLLGLLKHEAWTETGYFGEVFGRPFPEAPPWEDGGDSDPNADMWATAAETRADITGLARRAWAHADATIGALDLDAPGRVPWWPDERNSVTLHQILVHVATEAHRHAGHADIVRELIDGAAGLRSDNSNLPDVAPGYWERHREAVEAAAVAAARQARGPA
jgi:hypothetical protein